jgi:hypothetical protein
LSSHFLQQKSPGICLYRQFFAIFDAEGLQNARLTPQIQRYVAAFRFPANNGSAPSLQNDPADGLASSDE